eukprot:gnl/TRDRNA2_/TRDRNA2_188205_c0_seq1.p2 gnl/TRDRNA2_/TRDRNA2_188205_c0~~gnl/TRDRNA2_/TRDRNA2_188205_c0_seq1.p2  ORF type:complete len:118 (+),score=18.21 gnl/TRDRNA2_/TRDRNA2_188205_c0_seq1:31-384(+)
MAARVSCRQHSAAGHRRFAKSRRCCWQIAIMLLAFASLASAKPKKYGGGGSKSYWKKENECQRTTCKGIHTDENDDCIAKCVSETCWQEVYADDPMEPGQVDRPRQQKFNQCVKAER